MNLRTTLVLLGIALALGGYVWFGELRGKERQERAERGARRLVELARAEWTALELPVSDGGTARLEAGGGEWALASPLRSETDAATVERILDALEGLDYETEIERVPEDLAPFGLGDAGRRATLRAGERSLSLVFGGGTPVGSGRYVQVSSRPGRVFNVSGASVASLEPSLLSLRDKRIVRDDPESVRELAVRARGEAEIRMAREQGGWTLLAPLAGRADGRRIERLLEDLHFARASGFVDEPGEGSGFGLDPAEIEVEWVRADGSGTLSLGRSGDRAYARVSGRATVFELPDRIVSGVPREVFAYRYKRVFELDPAEVRRLELRFPREDLGYGFERDDSRWSADDEALSVDSLKLADLVYALESLDATAVEPEPHAPGPLGLEPARVRVTAFAAGGEELGWLELGDPDSERGLPARSSLSERVWRVPGELGEDVPLGLDVFRSDFAEPPDAGGEPAGEEGEGGAAS